MQNISQNQNFVLEEIEKLNEPKVDCVDFVLVYWKNSDKKEIIDNFCHNLSVNGLVLQHEENVEEELEFVLVNIPFEKCLELAEKIKLKLPIEVIKYQINSQSAMEDKHQARYFEEHRDKFTVPYNSKIRYKFEKFFNKENLENSISERDRILLVHEILSRTEYSERHNEPSIFSIKENDSNFGIERLLAKGAFIDAYPLHKDHVKIKAKISKKQFLYEYFIKSNKTSNLLPIFVIRDYFGEKVAFYFAWLNFYTSWLIFPSIVGFFVCLYGLMTYSSDLPVKEICDEKLMGNRTMCPICDNELSCKSWKLSDSCLYSKISYMIDNPLTVFYSIFMSIWAVLFIEFWKRKQYELQFEWDVIDFEKKNEPLRPDFENQVKRTRRNRITGEEELYVPPLTKFYRYILSVSMILLMMFLVLALVMGFILYRLSFIVAFPKDTDPNIVNLTTSISAGCINLFLIVLLNRFYSWLAVKLNDFELHPTDSKYEKALTIKMYLFEFVNYYASIFYIAFFKGKFKESKLIEKCDQSGCLSELCIQLAIIMIGKQIFNNIQEVLYPIVQNCLTKLTSSNKWHKNDHIQDWLKDYYLISWTNLTLFAEYLEMVIQYGFITIFAVAFPLGPLFSLMNNVIEIRIDAFKILTQYKRPLPKKAQDIGMWHRILSTISNLAVITNGLILAFTSDFIPRLVYKYSYENDPNHNNLKGYVEFTLSLDKHSSNGIEAECYYKDFRKPYNSESPYEYTSIFYHILAARLIFLVFFEHFVFSMVAVMHWIPDVPSIVQEKIDAENLIIQHALWESLPERVVSDQEKFTDNNLESRILIKDI